MKNFKFKVIYERVVLSGIINGINTLEWRGGVHIGEFFLVVDDPYVDYTTKRTFNWGVYEEYLQSF